MKINKRLGFLFILSLLVFTGCSSEGSVESIVNGSFDVRIVEPVDEITQAILSIDYEHHEIHSGNHFNYCEYILNLASGNEVELIVTTPNGTKWTHLTVEAYASEGATIELYEGASGIVGGSIITPRNNNRNSIKVSGLVFIKDPTSIANDGMRASGFLAGGGKTAGFTQREKEFILKANETYLIRITSLTVSNDVSWCAEWYEHTNKEMVN